MDDEPVIFEPLTLNVPPLPLFPGQPTKVNGQDVPRWEFLWPPTALGIADLEMGDFHEAARVLRDAVIRSIGIPAAYFKGDTK